MKIYICEYIGPGEGTKAFFSKDKAVEFMVPYLIDQYERGHISRASRISGTSFKEIDIEDFDDWIKKHDAMKELTRLGEELQGDEDHNPLVRVNHSPYKRISP